MSKNILVVDDNEVNLELITALIEQYKKESDVSITIFSAVNGEEAVKVCEENFMDLVFMDFMMPKMNGNEATILIKKNTPKTMIIAISSSGDEEKQKEILKNGAEDYILKPITAQLFKNRIDNSYQLSQKNIIKN